MTSKQDTNAWTRVQEWVGVTPYDPRWCSTWNPVVWLCVPLHWLRVLTIKLYMESPLIQSLHDIWKSAASAVPKIVFEYARGAATSERTLAANTGVFNDRVIPSGIPDKALSKEQLDFETEVLGKKFGLPIYICPIGILGSFFPNAELVAVYVFSKLKLKFPFMLSSFCCSSVEDVVKAANGGEVYFQLYGSKKREDTIRRIERARDAGATAVVVNFDTPSANNREENTRDDGSIVFKTPWEIIKEHWRTPGKCLWMLFKLVFKWLLLTPQMIFCIGWTSSYFAKVGGLKFAMFTDKNGNPGPIIPVKKMLRDSAFGWNDVPWIRESCGDMKLIAKGIETREQAEKAIELGFDGFIIGNHGARGNDLSKSVVEMAEDINIPTLPKREKITVFAEGGVQRPEDILILLALGVDSVGIGREFIAAICRGAPGLRRFYKNITESLDDCLRFFAVESIKEFRKKYQGKVEKYDRNKYLGNQSRAKRREPLIRKLIRLLVR